MANDDGNGRRFFTTSEVARYCAVTNDGVLKWIKSQKLRAFSTPGGHCPVESIGGAIMILGTLEGLASHRDPL